RTAAYIGKMAGVDSYVAGVLPDGKEEVIRSLQDEGKVAMIGDGINDAPALKRADIGIAIGAGTDVAIDSADVVLMNSSLKDAAAAIKLSRRTLTNIHENLFWAFFYNVICIPVAAGLFSWKMNPMIGAAAMSLSSFTVCMNALRLNLFQVGKNENHIIKTVNEQERNGDQMDKTIKVEGMMCEHCEMNVQKGLEALPFVANAKADHNENLVTLTLSGDFDEAAVKDVVTEKGYTYLGTK
ncbi:MAG: HAD-IC family P-type ATPase, partial [Lachnospiraceae bacterium]|nr:HAD-IC family P-type ATPase [Lachnospiraceae bacterium]